MANEIERKLRKSIVVTLGPAVFDRDVLAFGEPGFAKPPPERRSGRSVEVVASRYPITGIVGCWARATRVHATDEPAITLMKSRRRIAFPKASDHANSVTNYSRVLRPAKWGSGGQFARQQF
jgi:hypothetical protein